LRNYRFLRDSCPCADIQLVVPLRLVLIEDHQALREGLELLLSREGCEDDGIALTPTLPDADAGRRIMLYTGSADEELLFSGLNLGAQGYALNDGSPHELVGALRLVAEGGSYVEPRLRPALLSRRSTERLPSLSNREREIIDLLAQGFTGEQVAERLVLSAETIKTHIRNAMNKLEAHTRVHATAIALREGFISPPVDAGAAGG
jgi:DNA-binding NarL/FixJ family response regulator